MFKITKRNQSIYWSFFHGMTTSMDGYVGNDNMPYFTLSANRDKNMFFTLKNNINGNVFNVVSHKEGKRIALEMLRIENLKRYNEGK